MSFIRLFRRVFWDLVVSSLLICNVCFTRELNRAFFFLLDRFDNEVAIIRIIMFLIHHVLSLIWFDGVDLFGFAHERVM